MAENYSGPLTVVMEVEGNCFFVTVNFTCTGQCFLDCLNLDCFYIITGYWNSTDCSDRLGSFVSLSVQFHLIVGRSDYNNCFRSFRYSLCSVGLGKLPFNCFHCQNSFLRGRPLLDCYLADLRHSSLIDYFLYSNSMVVTLFAFVEHQWQLGHELR